VRIAGAVATGVAAIGLMTGLGAMSPAAAAESTGTATGTASPAPTASPPTASPPTASPPTPPSASAAASTVTGRIDRQSSTSSQLEVTFSAIGLAAGQSIALNTVQLFIDGTPVTTKATPIGGTAASPNTEVTRTAVLVVDVSGSMKGAGIDGAKKAALAFLGAVPPDVRVGLVVVSTAARLVAAPTTDRTALAADIAGLVAGGNTALYDGVLLAEQTAGADGSRTIVLLTDGHDDGSKTTLTTALAAATTSGAVIDAVSFGTAAAQVQPLQQLTGAAGGRLLATSQAQDFAPAFRRAAQDIATQVLVTAQVPPQFAGQSVTVSVRALAGNTTITDSAAFELARAAATTAAAKPPSIVSAGP
jgi:tight adherence protein B